MSDAATYAALSRQCAETAGRIRPGYPTDWHLARLFDAGLVILHYPPTRLRDDYWTLTPRGVQWLAQYDQKES